MTLLFAAILSMATPQIDTTPSSDRTSAQSAKEENQPADQHASPDPSVDELQNNSNKRPQEKKDQGRFLNWIEGNSNVINAASTAIMAIFTVALFITTYLLWKSGEKHSARELRAYVGIGDVRVKKFIAGKIMQAEVTFRNAGQTPAYNLSTRAGIRIAKYPYDEPLSNVPWHEGTATLEPNGSLKLVAPAKRSVTPEDIGTVTSGEEAVYVFVEIRYSDAFGKERFTYFRGYYHAEPFEPIPDSTGVLYLAQTSKYNQST